jgi:hypothetical protein
MSSEGALRAYLETFLQRRQGEIPQVLADEAGLSGANALPWNPTGISNTHNGLTPIGGLVDHQVYSGKT